MKSIIFTSVVLIFLGIFPSAFAQITEPITVTTDKSAYSDGDTILISGQVKEILSGFKVSLQIIAANGNLVTSQQLEVGSDKRFSTQITAGGSLWKSEGTYTIKVLYGTAARTGETTFEFGGTTDTTTTPTGPTFDVAGTNFRVGYEITRGNILNILPDEDAVSLIIQIDTTGDGQLTIIFPRTLIDAKIGERDDDFFVLVDGEEIDYDETKTSTGRILTIPFRDGSEEIEIKGTSLLYGTSTKESETITHITVFTDRTSYRTGDTITVFGEVRELRSGSPVTLQIIGANENRVTVKQLQVDQNKKFSTTLTETDDVFWSSSGTYTAKVTYGAQDTIAKTTFQFESSLSEFITVPLPTSELKPELETVVEPVIEEKEIPGWVRNIFIWYAEDRISEKELLEAIEFLIEVGVIHVSR